MMNIKDCASCWPGHFRINNSDVKELDWMIGFFFVV